MDRIVLGLMMNKVQKAPFYRVLSEHYWFSLLFFDPRGISWGSGSCLGLALENGSWRKGRFALPNVVYNRCYPEPSEVINRLGEIIGKGSIFNTRTQLDKWEVYECLRQSEAAAHLPTTYRYTENTLESLIRKRAQLILKPCRGSGGAGVYLLTHLASNSLTIHSHWPLPCKLTDERFYLPFLIRLAPPCSFIAQQYIEPVQQGGGSFDVRMLMQKNARGKWEMAGQLSRLIKAGTLLTNDYLAIVDPAGLIPGSLIDLLRSISHLVVEQLDRQLGGLGELGVDFLIDQQKKPWILEVNGKPDKGLFAKLKDNGTLQRVYLNPLHYLRFLSVDVGITGKRQRLPG